MRKVAKKHKEIAHIKTGFFDGYLINNPEFIQEVLVTNQRNFIKGEFLQRTKKVFGDGLLTSEGDFHHRQRRLIQPAFHRERISSYAKIMTAYTQRLCDTWQNGKTIDAHEEMNRLTMQIVAKCLFDADIQEESKDIANALTLTIEYFNRLSSPLSWLLERLPSNRKFEKASTKIDEMILRLIRERRKADRDTGDLLSMLLKQADEQGIMPDKQVRDEILILFAAGHETTANALTWTWYLLSRNPDVETKLHAEVDALLSGKGSPDLEDFPKLIYSTKVFRESIRIYPPAWILVRQALKDCAVGDYFIPAGSNILISQYLVHRDSGFYPDPEKYDPDRWTQEMKSKLPKFAYFPFGGGPRSCIGEPFAWMEGVLLLATIAHAWQLRHVAEHKVELLPRITLRPKYGMQMKLTRRNRD